MRRLFLRIYLALAVVLLTAVATMVALRPRPAEVELRYQIEERVGTAPEELTARFAQARSDEARREVASALQGELSMPVAVLPEGAVSFAVGGFARRSLGQREPVVLSHDSGPAIYLPLPDQDAVLVLRPGPVPPRFGGPYGATFGLALLLLIGGALYFMVRPVERQLEAITRAAERIRGGALDARAPVQRSDDAGQLAASFNAMAARVQAMVRGREALLHGVSHELRTPIARLRFALELLGDLPEQRDQRLAEIDGDLVELENLVSQLLRYAELDAPRSTVGSCDLGAVLVDLVDGATRLSDDLQVERRGPDTLPTALDEELVRRALGNLLGNAARYGAGRVRVTLDVVGVSARVVVEDDGPGVAVEARERIFEPFVRLDEARSRDTGGAGLGLALVRRATAALGGTIQVDDGSLGGARFTWSVPLKEGGCAG